MLSTVLMLALAVFLIWFLWEKKHRVSHPVQGGLDPNVDLPHTQEYELYHNSLSLCSKKARICLDELGIPYKSHQIDLIETGSYETISRHFLKVNPAGVLPTMVHNGNPVYESHDIIEYAAKNSKTPDLLIPVGEKEKALSDYWIHKASVVGEDVEPGIPEHAGNCISVLTLPLFASGMTTTPLRYVAVGLLFHRIKFRPLIFTIFKLVGLRGALKLPPLIKMLDKARHHSHLHLDELEKHLQKTGPWICGEQFTLADVSWLPLIERLREADWLDYFLHNRPAVSAYWKRLKSRDSYQSAIINCGHPSTDIATGWIKLTKLKNPNIKAILEAPRV